MSDDPLSPENLRKYFKAGTANVTDDQLKGLLRQSLTDDVIKKSMMAQIPGLMQDAEKSGKSKEELKQYEDQLTAWFSKPETIAKAREDIINDPQTLAKIRATLANPTDENIKQMHDAVNQSVKYRVANAVVEGCKKGYLDAGFWGVTSGAQVAVETLGSTSRLAKFLALGRGTPVVAIGVALVEGVFAYKDFKDGHYEEGSKNLGGSIGGLTATLAGGAATVGVLATAPAWVPVAVAGAIGVAGYYAGREIGESAYAIYGIHEIYKQLDAEYQPDQTRFTNLKGVMAEMLVNHPDIRAQFAAMGVKTTPSTVKGNDNWIKPDDFAAAMVDPKIGGAVTAKVQQYIEQKKAGYEKVRDDNDHWYQSRYFTFTDAGANEESKYEMAKIDARHMSSALSEIDGYKAQARVRVEAQAKANADLAKALEPFNKLPPGVQASITASLEKNWPAYQAQSGGKGMDHDTYMLANKAAITSKPEVLKIFQDAEDNIQYVAGKQLEEWKKTHASATAAEIETQKQALASALRTESLNSPDAFKAKVDHYRQLDAKNAAPKPVVKPAAASTPVTTNFQSAASGTPVKPVTAPALAQTQSPPSMTTAFQSAATGHSFIEELENIGKAIFGFIVNFLSKEFGFASSGSTPQTANVNNSGLLSGPRQPAPVMG